MPFFHILVLAVRRTLANRPSTHAYLFLRLNSIVRSVSLSEGPLLCLRDLVGQVHLKYMRTENQ